MANAIAPSMNATVDTITDAVESAIVRNNAPGRPPRFMLQRAVCRALRDINDRRAPLCRFNGVRTNSGGRRSSPSSPSLQFAPSACPTPGAAMFVRRLGAPSSSLQRPPMPHPSALPMPLLTRPPPVPPAVAQHWNRGGGLMAGRRDAPSILNRDAGAEAWPPGFAYDLNVAIPPTTLAFGRSYTAMAADGRPNQSRLSNAAALGDSFISSPVGGEAAPHH